MYQHKVSLLKKYSVSAQKREALIDHILNFSSKLMANEDGTEIFIVSTSPTDETVIFIYIVYASEEVRVLHENSDAYIQYRSEVNKLVEGIPEIIFLTPQGGKGLVNG